jgi:hypothetical protein
MAVLVYGNIGTVPIQEADDYGMGSYQLWVEVGEVIMADGIWGKI